MRSDATLAANAGDLRITAKGDVILNDAFAVQDLTIDTSSNLIAKNLGSGRDVILNANGDISASKMLEAGRDIKLNAGRDVALSGSIYAGGSVATNPTNPTTSGISLTAGRDLTLDAATSAYTRANFIAQAGRDTAIFGTIATDSITTKTTVDGTPHSPAPTVITTNGNINLNTGRDLTIGAGANLYTKGNFAAYAGRNVDYRGNITALGLNSLIAGANFKLGGNIAGNVNLSTQGDFDIANQSSIGGSLTLNVGGTIQSTGGLYVVNDLTLAAGRDITLGGTTQVGGQVNLNAANDITTGAIGANGSISLNAGNQITTAGTLASNQEVSLTAGGNVTVGAISAVGQVSLTTGGNATIQNSILSAQSVGVTAAKLVSINDAISAANKVTVNGTRITIGGGINAGQDIVLKATGAGTGTGTGTPTTPNTTGTPTTPPPPTTPVTTASQTTTSGDINIGQGGLLGGAQLTTGIKGLSAGGAISLDAQRNINIGGAIIASQSLTLNAGNNASILGDVIAGGNINGTIGRALSIEGALVAGLRNNATATASAAANTNTNANAAVKPNATATANATITASATKAELSVNPSAQLIPPAQEGLLPGMSSYTVMDAAKTVTVTAAVTAAVTAPATTTIAITAVQPSQPSQPSDIAQGQTTRVSQTQATQVNQTSQAANTLTTLNDGGNIVIIAESITVGGAVLATQEAQLTGTKAVNLNTVSVGGNLTIESRQGDINHRANVNVGGSYSATAQSIRSEKAITITGSFTTIADNAQFLGQLSIGSNLTVLATKLVDVRDAVIGGNISLTSSLGDVNLGKLNFTQAAIATARSDTGAAGGIGNNASSAGQLFLRAGNNINLTDAINVGGTLDAVTRTGAITISGAIVANQASLNAGQDIVLNNKLSTANGANLNAGRDITGNGGGGGSNGNNGGTTGNPTANNNASGNSAAAIEAGSTITLNAQRTVNLTGALRANDTIDINTQTGDIALGVVSTNKNFIATAGHDVKLAEEVNVLGNALIAAQRDVRINDALTVGSLAAQVASATNPNPCTTGKLTVVAGGSTVNAVAADPCGPAGSAGTNAMRGTNFVGANNTVPIVVSGANNNTGTTNGTPTPTGSIIANGAISTTQAIDLKALQAINLNGIVSNAVIEIKAGSSYTNHGRLDAAKDVKITSGTELIAEGETRVGGNLNETAGGRISHQTETVVLGNANLTSTGINTKTSTGGIELLANLSAIGNISLNASRADINVFGDIIAASVPLNNTPATSSAAAIATNTALNATTGNINLNAQNISISGQVGADRNVVINATEQVVVCCGIRAGIGDQTKFVDVPTPVTTTTTKPVLTQVLVKAGQRGNVNITAGSVLIGADIATNGNTTIVAKDVIDVEGQISSLGAVNLSTSSPPDTTGSNDAPSTGQITVAKGISAHKLNIAASGGLTLGGETYISTASTFARTNNAELAALHTNGAGAGNATITTGANANTYIDNLYTDGNLSISNAIGGTTMTSTAAPRAIGTTTIAGGINTAGNTTIDLNGNLILGGQNAIDGIANIQTSNNLTITGDLLLGGASTGFINKDSTQIAAANAGATGTHTIGIKPLASTTSNGSNGTTTTTTSSGILKVAETGNLLFGPATGTGQGTLNLIGGGNFTTGTTNAIKDSTATIRTGGIVIDGYVDLNGTINLSSRNNQIDIGKLGSLNFVRDQVLGAANSNALNLNGTTITTIVNQGTLSSDRGLSLNVDTLTNNGAIHAGHSLNVATGIGGITAGQESAFVADHNLTINSTGAIAINGYLIAGNPDADKIPNPTNSASLLGRDYKVIDTKIVDSKPVDTIVTIGAININGDVVKLNGANIGGNSLAITGTRSLQYNAVADIRYDVNLSGGSINIGRANAPNSPSINQLLSGTGFDPSAYNLAKITAGGNLSISANNDISHYGQSNAKNIDITVSPNNGGGNIINGGVLQGSQNVSITAVSLINTNSGFIGSGSDGRNGDGTNITLNQGNGVNTTGTDTTTRTLLQNDGVIGGKKHVTIVVGGDITNTGTIATEADDSYRNDPNALTVGNVSITTNRNGALNNSALIFAGTNLDLNIAGSITNTSTISKGEPTTVVGPDTQTTNSLGQVVTVSGVKTILPYTLTDALMGAGNNITINAQTLNNAGRIQAGSSPPALDPALYALGKVSITTRGDINNTRNIEDLKVTSNQLKALIDPVTKKEVIDPVTNKVVMVGQNALTGLITGNNINITTGTSSVVRFNNNGVISAINDVTLTTGQLQNDTNGRITGSNVTITTDLLANVGGIGAADKVKLNLRELQNGTNRAYTNQPFTAESAGPTLPGEAAGAISGNTITITDGKNSSQSSQSTQINNNAFGTINATNGLNINVRGNVNNAGMLYVNQGTLSIRAIGAASAPGTSSSVQADSPTTSTINNSGLIITRLRCQETPGRPKCDVDNSAPFTANVNLEAGAITNYDAYAEQRRRADAANQAFIPTSGRIQAESAINLTSTDAQRQGYTGPGGMAYSNGNLTVTQATIDSQLIGGTAVDITRGTLTFDTTKVTNTNYNWFLSGHNVVFNGDFVNDRATLTVSGTPPREGDTEKLANPSGNLTVAGNVDNIRGAIKPIPRDQNGAILYDNWGENGIPDVIDGAFASLFRNWQTASEFETTERSILDIRGNLTVGGKLYNDASTVSVGANLTAGVLDNQSHLLATEWKRWRPPVNGGSTGANESGIYQAGFPATPDRLVLGIVQVNGLLTTTNVNGLANSNELNAAGNPIRGSFFNNGLVQSENAKIINGLNGTTQLKLTVPIPRTNSITPPPTGPPRPAETPTLQFGGVNIVINGRPVNTSIGVSGGGNGGTINVNPQNGFLNENDFAYEINRLNPPATGTPTTVNPTGGGCVPGVANCPPVGTTTTTANTGQPAPPVVILPTRPSSNATQLKGRPLLDENGKPRLDSDTNKPIVLGLDPNATAPPGTLNVTETLTIAGQQFTNTGFITAGTLDLQVTELISRRHLADIGQRYQQNDTSSWQVVNGATPEPGGTITATHWKIGDQVKRILTEPGNLSIPGTEAENTAFFNQLQALAPGFDISFISQAVTGTATYDTHTGAPRPNPWKMILAAVAAIAITIATGGAGAYSLTALLGPGFSAAVGVAAGAVNAAFTAALVGISGQLITTGKVDWKALGKNVLIAALTAGLMQSVTSYLQANVLQTVTVFEHGVEVGTQVANTIGNKVITGITQALVSATVSTVVNGGNGSDFGKSFVNSIVLTTAKELAGLIGDKLGISNDTYFEHKIAHALLGCLAAKARRESCEAGALGAATSAFISGFIDTNFGSLFGQTGSMGNTIATEGALTAITGALAKLTGNDINTAIGAAQNEFENNYNKHAKDVHSARFKQALERLTECMDTCFNGAAMLRAQAGLLTDAEIAQLCVGAGADCIADRQLERQLYEEYAQKMENRMSPEGRLNSIAEKLGCLGNGACIQALVAIQRGEADPQSASHTKYFNLLAGNPSLFASLFGISMTSEVVGALGSGLSVATFMQRFAAGAKRDLQGVIDPSRQTTYVAGTGNGDDYRISNGITLDSRLPNPHAGLDYSPDILESSNPRIANSQLAGYLGELRLANIIADTPNMTVVHYGANIGSHGADVVAVNTETGDVSLWDNKFRSNRSPLPPSSTFAVGSQALYNALEGARLAIVGATNLPDAIKAQALAKLGNGDFKTITIGSGANRNRAQAIRFCGFKPC